jgi:hypothetical protein
MKTIYNGHEIKIESVNPLSIMFFGYIDGKLMVTSENYNSCITRLRNKVDELN